VAVSYLLGWAAPITGERIRDKVAASKRKGIWMGGAVPLGYRVENRALHVVEDEAESVRGLFRRYLEVGSVVRLKTALDAENVRSPIQANAGSHTDWRRVRYRHPLAANPSSARFNNKTNGVTPRRWLRLANPALAETISAAIGDSWVADLAQLQKLRPLADDAALRAEVHRAQRACKARFADWVKRHTDVSVDPDTIFDCQVKRTCRRRQFSARRDGAA